MVSVPMKLTPGDSGDDHDLIALADRGGKPVGETDVLVVEIDGDERIELASFVTEARPHVGEALDDMIEDGANSGTFGVELAISTGLGGEGGREADWD